MNVLFVCTYNRGRSQMAEAMFNEFAISDHADSAGTKVETPGDTLAQRAKISKGMANVLAVMAEDGYDLSENIQTQLTESMLDQYDKVIVMAEQDTVPDYLRESNKFEYWPIEDPVVKDLEDTRSTRDQVQKKVMALAQESGNTMEGTLLQ